jgi:hypothetical protein
MVTAAKKTPASPKSTAKAVTKKPVAKKVVTETKATAKTTPAATVKKPVAKTVVAKEQKLTTTKTATVAAKPEIKQPVKKEAAPKTTAVSVSADHRKHMIATAAYFIAQRRGFSGGYEVQDWISAEIEIDKQLKS